jgi:hypothetical protein
VGVVLLALFTLVGQVHAEPPIEPAPGSGLSAQEVGAVAQSRGKRRRGKKKQARHGWLRIYTSSGAQVTVDGQPYPRRSEYGQVVSANQQHEVKVKLGDKEKVYQVAVRPLELRTLLVDLAGYQTPPSAGGSSGVAKKAFRPAKKNEADAADAGKLTVYSKPKGEVYVDGSPVGATTPMINRELDLGRHEVQVKWETGTMSEVKTIRIRKGSKLKLFFRDRSGNK